MRKVVFIGLVACLLCACGSKQTEREAQPDAKAASLFQGIWVDDDSESVLFRASGDTIYYADAMNAPVRFEIKGDSLYTYGNEVSRYKVDKQSEYSFWFHSLSGDVVKLHKSDSPEDSLAFGSKEVQVIPIYTEVVQRDSVAQYGGHRCHAYVYINPSSIKVFKTSFSEEGFSVDNVYYDNVIHICVYEGKRCLYSEDITKNMFEKLVPVDFLGQAILSDMNFVGVGSDGFHYQASVCIPESVVCYLLDLRINLEGKLTMEVAES